MECIGTWVGAVVTAAIGGTAFITVGSGGNGRLGKLGVGLTWPDVLLKASSIKPAILSLSPWNKIWTSILITKYNCMTCRIVKTGKTEKLMIDNTALSKQNYKLKSWQHC